MQIPYQTIENYNQLLKTKIILKRIKFIFVLLCLVLSILVATSFAIDRYLPYEDKLKNADAVFVLDGEYPFRIWSALDIYNDGYAPLIIVPHESELHGVQKLAQDKRGYGSVTYDQMVSSQKPIPTESIRVMQGEYQNTVDELPAIFKYAREHGFKNIILVTSDYHARRVRILSDRRPDELISVIVRMTPYQAMLSDKRWIKQPGTRQVVLSEFFKILYHYLPEWLQDINDSPPTPASGLE